MTAAPAAQKKSRVRKPLGGRFREEKNGSGFAKYFRYNLNSRFFSQLPRQSPGEVPETRFAEKVTHFMEVLFRDERRKIRLQV